jgi:tRNA-dihydrouridine synthase A
MVSKHSAASLPAAGNLPPPAATLLSVAPMMERTDRHFRYLLRVLAPDLRLYTEMLTAHALVVGDAVRHLAYDESEHPIALQLGGNDPRLLAQAARIGIDHGYDEINLNIGCPSERVASGAFGACLMDQPDVVAACVAEIRSVVDVPVTVKTRCGIDDRDSIEFVAGFLEEVAAAGCELFVLHARKAILGGLSPKENRSIPPLQYPMVYELADAFPQLRFVINGGVRSTGEVADHLQRTDGVMIGRQAYSNPYWMSELQVRFLNPATGRDWQPPARGDVVRAMADYAEIALSQGSRLHHVTRHMLGLYAGQPGARAWRRFLTEAVADRNAGPEVLLASLRI